MRLESDTVKPGTQGVQGLKRDVIFRLRGLLPVPAVFIILAWSDPTLSSFLKGGVVILLGEILRIWAAGYIRTYRVSEVQADRLVTAGPYAFVRNPLYWGNFLIGLGFSIVSNWWPAYLLFGAVYAYIYTAVIPLEEAYLQETFPTEYEAYRKAVPRLCPRLTPYKGRSGFFSLREALGGESVTIAVHLTVAALFAVKLFI